MFDVAEEAQAACAVIVQNAAVAQKIIRFNFMILPLKYYTIRR
jgi:hypothetical protein